MVLHEYASKLRLGTVVFNDVQDEDAFTTTCTVFNRSTKGTAGSKAEAKAHAAQKAMAWVKPDVVFNSNNVCVGFGAQSSGISDVSDSDSVASFNSTESAGSVLTSLLNSLCQLDANLSYPEFFYTNSGEGEFMCAGRVKTSDGEINAEGIGFTKKVSEYAASTMRSERHFLILLWHRAFGTLNLVTVRSTTSAL